MGYVTVMVPSTFKQLQRITFFPVDKIFAYVKDESNRVYDHICNQCAIKLLRSTMKTLAILFISMVVLAMFPLIALLQNEVQLTLPVLFPFTDLEHQTGSIINLINQFFTGLIGFSGNVGIEIFNSILKNTIWTSATVICYAIDELTPILRKSKRKSTQAIDCRFKNIVLQVHDTDRLATIVGN